MRAFDSNRYINIPYVDGGRTEAGADCWGLVRLIYQNEFDIELPGHDGIDRCSREDAELAEYMAAHRENWERVRVPEVGDIVLMRLAGEPIHVGVVIAPGYFIHARADADVVAEKYSSTRWSHRIEGFYRYTPKAEGVTVSGCPHPLKMQRIDGTAVAGSTLAEAIDAHCAGVPDGFSRHGVAFVNGVRVDQADWPACHLSDGDRVEFRMFPGKSQDESLITSAIIMVVAWWAGGAVAGAWQGGAAAGAAPTGWGLGTGISSSVAGAVAQGAVSLLGNALVNAIAPANSPSGSGPVKPQYMLAGGANTATPYGAIPIVLGTHDFTPPLGANTFMSSDGSDRFLHMLLVWGYGPLDISNLRIGQTPLTDFADVTVYTIQGDANEFVDGHLDWDRQEVRDLLNVYGSDIAQQRPEAEITETFLSRTSTSTNLNRLSLLLTFPQGLTNMDHFNDNMGDLRPQTVIVVFEYRRLGYFNSSGIWVPVDEPWTDNFANVPGMPSTLLGYQDPETGYYPTGSGIVVLRDRNKLIYKPTQFMVPFSTVPLPNLPADNEVLVYTMSNGAMFSQHNTALYTGFDITVTTVTENIVEDAPLGGTYTRTLVSRWFSITSAEVEDFNIYRDATRDPFDKIIDINLNAEPGQYEVRLKRTNAETTTEGAADKVMLLAITEYSDNVRPVNPPKPMAMTALKIRATDQLNGSLEGLTGTVSSKQLLWDGIDWRSPGAADRRNNPASLILYVLRHPANAKPVPYSQIDLPALQHFSEFCDAHGFVYENVINGQRPVRDVINEIAAAGRASIAMPDGKWSVVIDEPKSQIAQHVTPSNSWGFKGVRLLPKLPHALRCKFLNRRKDYQPDEMLIYADGYNESNATLIEAIELPGVTQPVEDDGSPGPVWRLGRHHMEQIILRPEEYELYADIESVICTRGDRVKVAHDIPMWGLGSGRIKSVLGDVSTVRGLLIDDPVQVEAGKRYTVRWRTADNQTNAVEVIAAIDMAAENTVIYSAAEPVGDAVDDVWVYSGSENIFKYSEQFENAAWLRVRLLAFGGGSSANVITAPDGTTTADLFMADATGASYVYQSIPFVAGVSYVVSVYAKAGATNSIYMQSFTQSGGCSFVLSGSGSHGAPSGIASAPSISHVGGGWYRCSLTLTANVTANCDVTPANVSPANGSTYFWGAQIEAGASASKYIPTAGASVSNIGINTPYVWNGSNWIPSYSYGITNSVCNTLLFNANVASLKPFAGDQFMFGELDRESVDCLVKSVEPLNGLQARLLLCDYAPAVFDAETLPFGTWESQITLPPPMVRLAINQVPIITSLIADEGALTVVGSGFQANILVKWNTSSGLNASTVEPLAQTISRVEAQYRLTDSINAVWKTVPLVDAKAGAVSIGPLVERQAFDIRVRFVGEDGRTGDWLSQTAIYVTGKTNPPPNVTGLTYALEAGGIVLKWAAVSAVDLADYVVKRGASFATATEIATPTANEFRVAVTGAGGDPYWVVARDTSGNLSVTPASLTVPIVAPGSVTPTIAVTDTDYALHWSAPTAMFLIDYYEIRYGDSWAAGAVVGRPYSTVYQAPVAWAGERKFWVAAVDIAGNVGTATMASLTISAPVQPVVTSNVVDNNVLLYWTDARASLPITEYEIKRGAEVVGTKQGLFTTLFETVAGTYTYSVTGIDSAGNYGTPKTLTVTVSQPPDYVLRGDYDSSFAVSGNVTAVAFSNAKLHADVGGVVMPINTTETVAQHFTNHSWSTPQDQINAGYPIFIQPANSPGYYEETIDIGTTLGACKVTVSPTYTVIAGTPTVSVTISLSANGSTWTDHPDTTQVFGTGYRYVKVRVTVSGDDHSLISLVGVNTRLDAKLKTISGSKACLSTDSGGTTIYITDTRDVGGTPEFIDVEAIQVTAAGTSPITAIYDFTDSPNPTSFKILLFNSAGTRVSGTASWTVRGY